MTITGVIITGVKITDVNILCVSITGIHSFVPQVSYAKEIDAQFIDFDGLVRNCDFICVCCNLTPQVRYMLVLYEWFNVL